MRVVKGTTLILLPLLLVSTSPIPAQEPTAKMEAAPLPGYSANASASERDWETEFRVLPSTDNLREDMRHLSARPHHVGSPYDKENAEWILAHFKEWGLDASIETFWVLFPTPKERALELVAPTTFAAKLQEPPIAVDPTSNQQAEQLPTYNAYSIDGDVTAPLVYVNQGVRADYDQLDRMGVSVKGAIVIARYGGAWRGIKPKVAAEHGAVGCIIYSDPKDDGYSPGETFPAGPYRPGRWCATWRGDGHLVRGRPAHSRLWRDQGRQAPSDQGQSAHHQNSGAPHLLRRCAAAARGHRRPDRSARMARRTCPSPIMSVLAPRRCT